MLTGSGRVKNGRRIRRPSRAPWMVIPAYITVGRGVSLLILPPLPVSLDTLKPATAYMFVPCSGVVVCSSFVRVMRAYTFFLFCVVFFIASFLYRVRIKCLSRCGCACSKKKKTRSGLDRFFDYILLHSESAARAEKPPTTLEYKLLRYWHFLYVSFHPSLFLSVLQCVRVF